MASIWRWLLFAPLLLTLLVPPSIMPVRSSDGSFTVVICTGDGPLELQIDPVTGEPVPAGPDDADSDCHWNALRDIALLEPPGIAPVALARPRNERTLPTRVLPRKLARFERPPARASPHLI